jgi:DNA-binding NarL/FixJ family response regulator
MATAFFIPTISYTSTLRPISSQQSRFLHRPTFLYSVPQAFGDPENPLVHLVDDEESIRTAVGKFLADKSYRVLAFEDAASVLAQLRSAEQLPKVLVSDIRMPGMDGLQLLSSIRKDAKLVHLPVILLTAKGTTLDRVDGYNAGADAYIPKPFDPEELVAVLENVIEKHASLSNAALVGIQELKRDLDDIKKLLLEQGGGGVGINGFVKNKDAMDEDVVYFAPDERNILELLCQGLMNKEIADRTYLSTRRVEQLLTSMYRKTKVKSRTELVRWAIRTGTVLI